MRNDFTAGPQLANAAPISRARLRRRRMVRGMLVLPLALMLIAPGASALAAEATTGYSQTTPPPTTTTTKTQTTPATKTEPTKTAKGGVSPSSTSSTPTGSNEPASSSNEPAATTAKASTLPFTGLDLRWVILAGVLLVGLGLSIVVSQRARRDTGR
jgi:uncharacterized surface anchored protein